MGFARDTVQAHFLHNIQDSTLCSPVPLSPCPPSALCEKELLFFLATLQDTGDLSFPHQGLNPFLQHWKQRIFFFFFFEGEGAAG